MLQGIHAQDRLASTGQPCQAGSLLVDFRLLSLLGFFPFMSSIGGKGSSTQTPGKVNLVATQAPEGGAMHLAISTHFSTV